MNIDLDKFRNDESGIALIIAIILILIMTTLGSTISFLSNNDFYSMSNYKSGQEAFLASESCVIEIRKILENVEPAEILELKRSDDVNPENLESELGSKLFIQSPISPFDVTTNGSINPDPATWEGPLCRTGSRALGSAQIKKPSNYLITKDYKGSRHVTNNSIGMIDMTPISIIVTGKDSFDGDKTDENEHINTGIEIVVGFEVLSPGAGDSSYNPR
jgi:hypothetical protein